MKLLFVFLVSIFSFVSFAGDIPVKINDTLTLYKSVSPDKMVSSVSVSYTGGTYAMASMHMEKIAAVVKAHSDTCKFNSYYVSPQYTYTEKKRTLTGYQGSINIPCEFTDIKEFDSVLNDLYTVVNAVSGFDMSQSRVSWIISDDLLRQEKAVLKDSVISSANALADKYSAATGKNCMLNVLTFEGATADMPIEFASVTRSATMLKSTAPDQTAKDINVSADFTFICK